MKWLYYIGSCACALAILAVVQGISYSQEEKRKIEVTAQGILSRVDRIMAYPTGMLKGKIKHILPDGKDYSIQFTGYISPQDFLFKFQSRDRGDQLKVLYNLGGEDIWVYNIHALKLFHKLGIDKYDLLLGTNFTFIDLSNADLQSNYNATIVGESFIKGYDAYRLNLEPIYKGSEYGLLTLYVTKDKFVPLRIDYHDRDKAIFKFLTLTEIQENDTTMRPLRYDMMDIRKGTVTILEFSEFESQAAIDKELFRPDKLGE